MNTTVSEAVALVAYVMPQLLHGTTASTTGVKLGKDYRRIRFVLSVGATDEVVDMAAWASASTSAGTAMTDKASVTLAITQIAANGDNRIVTLEVSEEDLAVFSPTGVLPYVGVTVTTTSASGTTGAYVSVVAEAYDVKCSVASDYDIVAVAQHKA